MSQLFVAGRYANMLSRPNVVITASSPDAAFPASRLGDGLCGPEARMAAVGTDQTFVVSGNLLPDPGAEASGAGWSKIETGSGVAATVTGSPDTGSRSFQCTRGTGSAEWYVDVAVRAGELLKADARHAETSTGTSRLRIRNLTTGNYLTSGGAWQAAVTDWHTTTSNTFVTATVTFGVESTTLCHGQPTVLLRYSLVAETASTVGKYDTLALYTGVTWASIHGWGGGMGPLACAIESNTAWDGTGAYTTRATLTKQFSEFYGTFGVQYALWWRLKLTGTSVTVPSLGELVLGQHEVAPTIARYDWVMAAKQPQVRHVTPGGDTYVYNVTAAEVRGLRLSFQMTNDSTLITRFRDDILRRCGYGEYPIVFVPWDAEPDVIHGRIADTNDTRRVLLDVWGTDLMIVGSGMPTSGL